MGLRSKNRCNDCEHEWLAPLGEDLVSRCPSCRSAATEIVEHAGALRRLLDVAVSGLVISGIVALMLILAVPLIAMATLGAALTPAVGPVGHVLVHAATHVVGMAGDAIMGGTES